MSIDAPFLIGLETYSSSLWIENINLLLSVVMSRLTLKMASCLSCLASSFLKSLTKLINYLMDTLNSIKRILLSQIWETFFNFLSSWHFQTNFQNFFAICFGLKNYLARCSTENTKTVAPPIGQNWYYSLKSSFCGTFVKTFLKYKCSTRS